MRTSIRRILYVLITLGVMLALSGGLVLALDSSQPTTPSESIREALEQARAQSSMHVVADIEQIVIPRPIPANVGESEEHYAFRVQGDITQRMRLDGMEDRRARMRFDVGGQGEAMELLLVNNEVYVGYQGNWQAIDDPMGGVAPTGDYLGYLNAVVDVTELEPVATEQGIMRRYSFEIDGKRYAEYQLERMKLALAGKLPQGAEIRTSPAQEAMSGVGELWVDESGLPRRQILDIHMPGVSTGYDADATMDIGFSRYGDPVPGIQAPQADGISGELVLPEPPAATTPAGEGAISSLGFENDAFVDFVRPFTATTARLLVILPLLALTILLMRRRHTIHVAVAWAMVVMIVAQPLVHASQYTSFSEYLSSATTLDQAFTDVGGMSMFQGDGPDLTPLALEALAQSSSGGELQDCRSFDTNPQGDYDNDGLSNADEWCLGTEYEGNQGWDSDGDLITDTVEVEGFTFNGVLYTTDPLQRDTNGDGMSDGQEWKPSITDQTQFQRFMDLDGDGVPNPWDKDNDGDGVPDAQDISPYSTSDVLGYRPEMDLKINTVHTDTTVYVDIAVQPKEASHLRYSLTSLDWPPDDQGQIQDLDNSVDDITLFPILSFTSNFTPTLADEYGIAETGAKGTFWAPLQPVEEAGNIYAFSTRIAFTNKEITNNLGLGLIGGAKILWMSQAKFDEYTNCMDPDNPGSTSCDVTTRNSTLATYPGGDFRVTGLNVSESKDVQVGLFGTSAPEISTTKQWDEDYVMGKVMNKGMGIYLHYVNPDLIDILNNQDTTFTSWGITPTLMYYTATTYPHRDEALATTGTTTTVRFLDDNYVDCSVSTLGAMTPTVILAYDSTSSHIDYSHWDADIQNGEADFESNAAVSFVFSMTVPKLYDSRQVQLSSYACVQPEDDGTAPVPLTPEWTSLGYNDTIRELNRRYKEATNNPDEYGSVQNLFLIYNSGLSNIISIDGVLQKGVQETAPDDAFNQFDDFDTSTLPAYLSEVMVLDKLNNDISSRGAVQGVRDWGAGLDIGGSAGFTSFVTQVSGKLLGIMSVYKNYRKALKAAEVNEEIDPDFVQGETEVTFSENVEANLEIMDNMMGEDAGALEEAEANIGTDVAEADVEFATTSIGKIAQGVGAVVAVGMTAYSIYSIWNGYNQNTKGLSNLQKDQAKAQAIIATIIQVIQLIIDLIIIALATTGIGLVVALLIEILLFAIVWLIEGLIHKDANPSDAMNNLVSDLTKAFVKFELLAGTPDKNAVAAGPMNTNIGPPAGMDVRGPVPGSIWTINTAMSTTVEKKGGGSSDDLKNSWAFARWGNADIDFYDYITDYSVHSWPPTFGDVSDVEGCSTNPDNGSQKICATSGVTLTFSSTIASRNIAIPYLSELESRLRYQECGTIFGLGKFDCAVKSTYSSAPDPATSPEGASTAIFYLDLIPATVDKLFNWDAGQFITSTNTYSTWDRFNVDKDNDGLSADQERGLGTKDDEWDTDSDGLSDGWEHENADRIGSSPLMTDTDSDGLSDYWEVVLGAVATDTDTDDDGLLDGEEACRHQNGKLIGGWNLRQVGNYKVCSNPLIGDADGDKLLDGMEKRAGLSPNAPNTAPWLQVDTEPGVVHNGGLVTVLKAGDPLTISLSLNNTMSGTIELPMTLDYDQNDLQAMTVVSKAGSTGYTPSTPTATAAGLNWDLAGNPLYAVEAMTYSLSTLVDPSITESQETALLATVNYTDIFTTPHKATQISQTVPVLIDMTPPTSKITNPTPKQAINGATYIMGGTAADTPSWPVQVEVRITGPNGYVQDWDPANGDVSWAYSWSPLPADGLYAVESRAFDYVGNMETLSSSQAMSVPVIVDNSAPVAQISNYQDGDALTFNGSSVKLEFSASDLVVSGVNDVAGVQLIQLSIDNRPWVNVKNYGSTPVAESETGRRAPIFYWKVNQEAYGSHSLAVRAVDALGQIGEANVITVIVDTLPPTDMWSNFQDSISSNDSFTMLGHADDEGNVPLPARPQELEGTMDAVMSSTVMLMPRNYTETVGMNVTWLGDVNGDRRADLAVGLPSASVNGVKDAGRVAIVYGQPGGWPVPPDTVALEDSATSLIASGGTAPFGKVVASAGDFNADGLDDILVGDPGNNQVYLVYGQEPIITQIPDLTKLSTSGGLGVIFTLQGNGSIGNLIASAGDVDGDSYDDILIGVTGLNAGTESRMYLIKGFSSTGAGIVQVDTTAVEYFELGTEGVATGVGDVNDDQYGDFVISDPNNSFGAGQPAVYLFLGPPTWRQQGETGPLDPGTRANASFTGDSSAAVGAQVVALGDINGDTLPDFAYSSGNAPRVAYGRTEGFAMALSADVSFDGYTSAPPNAFIAAPGDVDVDGLNDILLGATSGGGLTRLVLGSAELATNQPVHAHINGVSSAASAPYAAGADLNCDASSDLLLIPQGEFSTLSSQGGVVATQLLSFGSQSGSSGNWIGPAPRPRLRHELPGNATSGRMAASNQVGAASLAQTPTNASLTTPAVAFKVYDNNIDNWATNAAIAGDWNNDGKSDVAGWDGSQWQIWLSGGLNAGGLSFQNYSSDLADNVSGGDARIVGDFDSDGRDDIGFWDSSSSSWLFVRTTGPSNGSVDFASVTNNLGDVASGDASKVFVGDFDGDGKADVAAWNGSTLETYRSQASATDFNFQSVSNNLGFASSAELIAGNFDGDTQGRVDIASRDSDTGNWVIWISQGLSGNALNFQQVTDTSLGYAITSAIPRKAADFSGDGKTDVLALLNDEFSVWLSQASAGSGAAPFRKVRSTAQQFSGQFPADSLIGDFDGDGKVDYASLDKAGTGWEFQLAGLARNLYVDDDYCSTCGNDGHTWSEDAFDTIQAALDAAWFADEIDVAAGVYTSSEINAGRDFLTLSGMDADAVFIDAAGGVGITVFPDTAANQGFVNIEGVTIQNFTIRNASTGIEINNGGAPFDDPKFNNISNIHIGNVLLYQGLADSTALKAFNTAIWVRHNTLVSNATGVTLVQSIPGALVKNYVFLQDNLFVALENKTPLPLWWLDGTGQTPGLNLNNGFASQSGATSDWQNASDLIPLPPNAILTTNQNAKFLNQEEQIFRITSGSSLIGKASDGKDMGYYTYHAPVYVDPDYCDPGNNPDCKNEGRTWGVDAFNSIQAGIDSGALKVLVDPGVYSERISLVNGVSVLGSGAGHTWLEAPDDAGGFVVGVEHARRTTLGLMTVAGNDSSDGIMVDHQGSLELRRSILRNMDSALTVSGVATATLVNNTIANNTNGVIGTDCGSSIDIRNSIIAFNQGIGLSFKQSGCPATLHTFNDYWRNGHDFEIDGEFKDEPGSGEIFGDPRFTDPNNLDYRPLSDSPVVDVGDPSDPAPPGSGVRVDMGYAQSTEAAVYASTDYCEIGCGNDGLEWGTTAFATIQDAIDNVPDIAGIWTVGVDGGTSLNPMVFQENVTLVSGIRLVGSGADTTIIDAGGDDGDSALAALNGLTDVEIMGFNITNSGERESDAGIKISGPSNNITITRNIIGGYLPSNQYSGNGNAGVIFQNGASGILQFNTIATNIGPGVMLAGNDTWLQARYNIIAWNDVGFDTSGGGQVFHAYNLVYNTDPGDNDWCETCVDYYPSGSAGEGEINKDPQFKDIIGGDFSITAGSPAVDAIPATESGDVPTGGNNQADMGYSELLAMPATLLLGREGNSCGLGASGIASVDVGLAYVADTSESIDDSAQNLIWSPAVLATEGDAGSYWTYRMTQSLNDGLYRLYTKPADESGNVSDSASDWYRTSFIADSTPPAVVLVTPGNGSTSSSPALSLKATVSDWTPTGVPGQLGDTIADVFFLINGESFSATQAITIASQGDPQAYSAQIPLANGTYTVTALAVDQAGNTGESSSAQVNIVTTQNQAALANPAPGSAVSSASVDLSGYVHFQDASGTGQVAILVDGVSQGQAVLADTAAQATSWSKAIALSGEGEHTLTMRASRSAGNTASGDTAAKLVLDTTAPQISFTPPQETVVISVTLSGQASDTATGLASVAVSTDAGRSYENADVDNAGNWSYVWTPALWNDFASFPLRVRATDLAGNAQIASAAVIVDNLGPSGIRLTSATPQPGSHVTLPATVDLTWQPPTDGSGTVDIWWALDQFTETVPSSDQMLTSNSFSEALPGAGTWYVHLATVDAVGNRTIRHFGPWYAETTLALAAPPPGSSLPWRSSIQVNGHLDLADGEWEPDTELLGSDPRPDRVYDLYTSWDADYIYFGWQGPLWGPDGVGHLYFDTGPGGSSTAYKRSDLSLPFAADYMLMLRTDSQTLLQYAGGDQWVAIDDPGFLFADSGRTSEFRLSRSTLSAGGAVHILAASISYRGHVSSVLPPDNPTAGPWTSAYSWPELAHDLAPNAGQPDAHHAQVQISRVSAASPVPGPGSAIQYAVEVTNGDVEALDDVTLIFSGDEYLHFELLDGWPSAQAQSLGDRWFIDLGSLPSGTREPITITARVVEDLDDANATTVTAEVQAGLSPSEPDLALQSLTVPVDSQPPVVSIDLPNGNATMRSGPQTIIGGARDQGGGGIAQVEVQVNGGPWSPAQGAESWQATVDVPASGEFTLAARAIDIYGYTSELASVQITVDNEGPVVTMDLIADLLGGNKALISGDATDLFPDSGIVERVEVQVDDGFWREATVATAGDSTVRWQWNWSLPREEMVQHTLRARAVDVAGNVGPETERTVVTVDSTAPVSVIAYPRAGDVLDSDQLLAFGLASDGGDVMQVQVSQNGGRTWRKAVLAEDARNLLANRGIGTNLLDSQSVSEFVLWAITLEPGDTTLALSSRATDVAGNVERARAPLRIRVETDPRRLWLPLIRRSQPPPLPNRITAPESMWLPLVTN